MYSVRSAYKMLQVQKGAWDVSSSTGMWSKFWKIKVPSKVAHVCWRALTRCLPTMTLLFSRYVPVQLTCPVCNTEEEIIFHAMVSCNFATQCWHKILDEYPRCSTSNFKDWFSHILATYNSEK